LEFRRVLFRSGPGFSLGQHVLVSKRRHAIALDEPPGDDNSASSRALPSALSKGLRWPVARSAASARRREWPERTGDASATSVISARMSSGFFKKPEQ